MKSRSSCWSSQGLWSAAARSAGGYEGPYGAAVSPTHPGPREESAPTQRARAAELACDGRHHLNGESEHLTQLRTAVGRTWPVSVSVRSVRSCRTFGRLSALHIRMAITYSPNPRWKVCLPQITSDKQNTVSATKAMITTPILATSTVATTGKAPCHYHASVMTRRCETHLDRGFGHDTTRHETRSEMRGLTNERGDRWTEAERACLHTRAWFS